MNYSLQDLLVRNNLAYLAPKSVRHRINKLESLSLVSFSGQSNIFKHPNLASLSGQDTLLLRKYLGLLRKNTLAYSLCAKKDAYDIKSAKVAYFSGLHPKVGSCLARKQHSVSGALFKTLHFLRNLQRDPITLGVYPLHSFPAKCNVTLQLIGPIPKFHWKGSIVNKVPGAQIRQASATLANIRLGAKVCKGQTLQLIWLSRKLRP